MFRSLTNRINENKEIELSMYLNKSLDKIAKSYFFSAVRNNKTTKKLPFIEKVIENKNNVKNKFEDLTPILLNNTQKTDFLFVTFNSEPIEEFNDSVILETINFSELELKSQIGKSNKLLPQSPNTVIADVNKVDENKSYKDPTIFKVSNGGKIVASIEDDESLYVI